MHAIHAFMDAADGPGCHPLLNLGKSENQTINRVDNLGPGPDVHLLAPAPVATLGREEPWPASRGRPGGLQGRAAKPLGEHPFQLGGWTARSALPSNNGGIRIR